MDLTQAKAQALEWLVAVQGWLLFPVLQLPILAGAPAARRGKA